MFSPPELSIDPVIIVANSVDGELNTKPTDFICQEREVKSIEPEDFDEYKSSSYIVILGGHKAEGTGDIVKEALSDDDKKLLSTETAMIIKFNVWRTNQIVVILAGPDREHTQKACEQNILEIVSLFEGIDHIKTLMENSIAFLHETPVYPSDAVGPYTFTPLTGDTLSYNPYTLEEKSWFFWVDDAPCAKYAHPTRFIFIGVKTRSITIYQEEWWPVLNGRPLWISSDYGENPCWVSDGLDANPHLLFSHITHSTHSTRLLEPKKTISVDDRALIINGCGATHPFSSEFSTDEVQMKTALQAAGMNAESVHTIQEIKNVLHRWSHEMLPHETVIMYITAHGGRGYFIIQNEVFRIYELVSLLDKFDQRVHIHIIIDSSYSGSLIDPLKVLADSVIVSTGERTPAYTDWDPQEDVNPSDTGSEFTSGLASCIKELARDTSKIESWKNTAYAWGESWYIYLLAEVFKTNRELDACAHTGLTQPRMWKHTEILLEEAQPKDKEGEEGGCPCGS